MEQAATQGVPAAAWNDVARPLAARRGRAAERRRDEEEHRSTRRRLFRPHRRSHAMHPVIL